MSSWTTLRMTPEHDAALAPKARKALRCRARLTACCVCSVCVFLLILTENSNRKNNKLELNASISMGCAKPLVVISCFDWVEHKSFSR